MYVRLRFMSSERSPLWIPEVKTSRRNAREKSSRIDLKVISMRLGHSCLSFAADVYTSVVPKLAQDAADATIAVIPRRLRKA